VLTVDAVTPREKLLNEVRKDDEGAAMAEYVVLLGLIVGVLVLVITNFADVLHTKFTAVCSALGGAC
jgi:Flp pilus assembly pilin Flp